MAGWLADATVNVAEAMRHIFVYIADTVLFNMIQLCSSFKPIISFTFSSLMFKISDSEQLDKFCKV